MAMNKRPLAFVAGAAGLSAANLDTCRGLALSEGGGGGERRGEERRGEERRGEESGRNARGAECWSLVQGDSPMQR